MTGFCSSPRFAEHVTGPHHPERPDRIRAVLSAVAAAGLLPQFHDILPAAPVDFALRPVGDRGVRLKDLGRPVAAPDDAVLAVHTRRHFDHVRRVCAAGGGVLDQGDTPVGANGCEIALLAAGAVLRCCDAVATGEVRRAFAAVRPPGHHAEPDRPMGFCLFSNVAMGARHLQRRHGVDKVAIVDFDVHHGNGTQAVFEADPSVLFISLHEDPRTLYPGSGYAWETGTGAGIGTTLNIPFNAGAGDEDYIHAMEAQVLPELDKFRPEVLMISAGFDAHAEDPLAHINLTEEGFEHITQLLVESANRHCGGRVVSALEGGYNLRALGRSIVRHLIALNH
ncbi:MAG TPA: histone deacetylase [Tepidisphaeraceae bacterium]|nr:histone deacetylase [Tepidisphaeraceae bacterium]